MLFLLTADFLENVDGHLRVLRVKLLLLLVFKQSAQVLELSRRVLHVLLQHRKEVSLAPRQRQLESRDSLLLGFAARLTAFVALLGFIRVCRDVLDLLLTRLALGRRIEGPVPYLARQGDSSFIISVFLHGQQQPCWTLRADFLTQLSGLAIGFVERLAQNGSLCTRLQFLRLYAILAERLPQRVKSFRWGRSRGSEMACVLQSVEGFFKCLAVFANRSSIFGKDKLVLMLMQRYT